MEAIYFGTGHWLGNTGEGSGPCSLLCRSSPSFVVVVALHAPSSTKFSLRPGLSCVVLCPCTRGRFLIAAATAAAAAATVMLAAVIVILGFCC